MVLMAALCAGLFAGAALYVSAVEHPARMSCGTELALREFGPSYKRGAVMQAGLAVLGSVAEFFVFWNGRDPWVLVAGLLLFSAVPYTLLFILPTNKRLLDPALKGDPSRAAVLLTRWGWLHAGRTVLGVLSFLILLWRVRRG